MSIFSLYIYLSFPTNGTFSFLSLTLKTKKSQRLLLSFSEIEPTQLTFSDLVSTVMEPDWDLFAVVRGCTTATTTSSAATTTTTTSSSVSSSASGSSVFFSSLPAEQGGQEQVLSLSNSNSNLFEAKNSIEELNELCKPFFMESNSSSLQKFSFSSSSNSPYTQLKQQNPNIQPHHSGSATTPRSKRRKNQLKKVCQVPAEDLSLDIWAWRKYGQKPIKGSPYPRGYYRCSSSKGCLARKQVERNRSDPTMFIVTYTGEHTHPAPTHRNSLAGSTRQKSHTPQAAITGESGGASLAKPASPTALEVEEEVIKSESREEDMEDLMNDEEEENEFGLSDMVVTDDFFEGLDELTDPVTTNISQWPNDNNVATAGGGS